MTLDLKGALQELDVMTGWRALILLPPAAANAEGILEVLSWIEKGAPRFGTTMHLFDVKQGLVLVTGGVLTEKEGVSLFDIHDQLKGVATRMFVVPPASAPQALIARMYDTGAAPLPPVAESLPSSRIWSILCGTELLMCLILLAAGSAAGARGDHAADPLFKGGGILFWAAVLSGIKVWLQKRKLREALEEPVRMAQMQWGPTLPPFAARR
jgi:hypothetical protein